VSELPDEERLRIARETVQQVGAEQVALMMRLMAALEGPAWTAV
jgi:hypothetical protein